MKKIKIIIGVVSIFSFASLTSAKEFYYFHNGIQIPLLINKDSVCVYREINNKDGQKTFSAETISKTQNEKLENESITSVEYIIQEREGKQVKMSNMFYVQLFDPINDVEVLRNTADKTNTIVNGSIPNMPDWYELVVNHSKINNSLEMSNYFYETGLFKNVDPGFIFDFSHSSACVTDSNFTSRQWGFTAINACDAWEFTKGSPNIKIAIIDAAIYTSHREFNSTIFVNFYNTTTHDSIPDVEYSLHGTNVCGIIAADHNHAQIAGVAPNCKIMPISYTTQNKNVVAANLASGISWAVNHGADVINCSWGDHNGQYQYLHSNILESAIQNALITGRNGKGCTIVFASGNEGANQVDYPAYVFSDILTVGSISSNNSFPYFSSYDENIDIVAPGTEIYTTAYSSNPNMQYIENLGTSFSAPFVSGLAGLILSINPNLTQKGVADIIESSTQKVGNYLYTLHSNRPNGLWNDSVGYGLVDAHAAVVEAIYRLMNITGFVLLCNSGQYGLQNLQLERLYIGHMKQIYSR